MFMRSRFIRFFLFLSLFFLLIGGLRNISYRNAYYRGFQAGQYSAEQAERAAPPADGPAAEAAPRADYGPGYHGHGHGYHRGPFGIFNFLFMLLFIAFFFKVMRRLMWGGWGRRHWDNPKGWGHYRHGRKNWGPFNEYDGRSAKERKYDESGDDGPTYEM